MEQMAQKMITKDKALRERYEKLGVDVVGLDNELKSLTSKDIEAKRMFRKHFGFFGYWFTVNYLMISSLAADLYYKTRSKKI